MASTNTERSTTSELSTAHGSSLQPKPAAQLLEMEIDEKEKLSFEQAKMETGDSPKQISEETYDQDEKDYQELLAQKDLLEAELKDIIDGLEPLKIQLEELDKSIAQDEAELPILEAAMMAEVREFLALSPKYVKIRPGA